MTPTTHPQTKPHPRRDGWTPQRRQQFLDCLAAGLDVRRAAKRVGLSRQAAYKLRTRDAGFVRAWDAARRAALAADERRFREEMAQRPWARAVLSGACLLREGDTEPGTVSQMSEACELRLGEASPRSPTDPGPALRSRAFGSRCPA